MQQNLFKSVLIPNLFVYLRLITFVIIMFNQLIFNTMARIYGLNGLIRGRQGNNVYSIMNGTQVLKVYNPAVSNPRTIAQREQRAKFALAGKLSGCTPNDALIGLPGGNNRARRSRFVSSIVLASSVSGSVDNLVASVPISSLQWSEGSIAVWSQRVNATAVWGSGGYLTVTVPAMALRTGAPSGYGELCVVALFDPVGRMLDNVQCGFRSNSELVFNYVESGGATNVTVAVWICPFVPDTAVSRGTSSGLYPTGVTSIDMQVNARSAVSSYNWGNSAQLNVIAVTPANQMASLDPNDDRVVEDVRQVSANKK